MNKLRITFECQSGEVCTTNLMNSSYVPAQWHSSRHGLVAIARAAKKLFGKTAVYANILGPVVICHRRTIELSAIPSIELSKKESK